MHGDYAFDDSVARGARASCAARRQKRQRARGAMPEAADRWRRSRARPAHRCRALARCRREPVCVERGQAIRAGCRSARANSTTHVPCARRRAAPKRLGHAAGVAAVAMRLSRRRSTDRRRRAPGRVRPAIPRAARIRRPPPHSHSADTRRLPARSRALLSAEPCSHISISAPEPPQLRRLAARAAPGRCPRRAGARDPQSASPPGRRPLRIERALAAHRAAAYCGPKTRVEFVAPRRAFGRLQTQQSAIDQPHVIEARLEVHRRREPGCFACAGRGDRCDGTQITAVADLAPAAADLAQQPARASRRCAGASAKRSSHSSSGSRVTCGTTPAAASSGRYRSERISVSRRMPVSYRTDEIHSAAPGRRQSHPPLRRGLHRHRRARRSARSCIVTRDHAHRATGRRAVSRSSTRRTPARRCSSSQPEVVVLATGARAEVSARGAARGIRDAQDRTRSDGDRRGVPHLQRAGGRRAEGAGGDPVAWQLPAKGSE